MKKGRFLLTLLFIAVTAGQALAGNAVLPPPRFQITPHPMPAPTAPFKNENGESVSLRDFRGKIVLLNIWSTSCAQCLIEMPMLDRLQQDMGGVKFEVVALSSDSEPLSVLRRFWINRGLKKLKIYSDPTRRFFTAADIRRLPTTLLIDDEGREAGRIVGIAEWDGPKIKAQIRDLIRAAKEKAQEKKRRAELEKAFADTPDTVSAPAESVAEKPLSLFDRIKNLFK